MYVPAHFQQTDQDASFDLIDNNSFGLLVARSGDTLDATHLPFVLDRSHGALGTLRGHVARANPIWQHFEQEMLVVFQGPHAYISPDWFETAGQVPTWNYAAVHVYGRPRIMDKAALRALLEDLSMKNETPLAPKPVWLLDKLKPARLDGMMDHIVGFDIEIERMESKFKLSQNRAVRDIDSAVGALRDQANHSGGGMAGEVADLMARHRPRRT